MQSEQMQQAGTQQKLAANAQEGGGPQDTIATGGMPEGASEVPVGAMDAMAGGAGHPAPEA